MKSNSRHQVQLAHPIAASGRRQSRRMLAWKRKGVDAAGVGQTGTLLPIPPHESARRAATKQTVEVSSGSGQVGSAAQQRKPLMRGK